MQEKPAFPDERISAMLREAYALTHVRVEFLPLGFDTNTAVYRVVPPESGPYFLKLRSGNFEETSVLLPRVFHEQGIRQIIAPIQTKNDQLWSHMDTTTFVLYPFIEGTNGFDQHLTEAQWVDFGAALKAIHRAVLPPALLERLPLERYSAYWREMVKGFQEQVAHTSFDEPVAARMAAAMRERQAEITRLVERTVELASVLQSQPLEHVLCHADIHAGNLLLAANGDVYIVDWDNPILAPKERDLMFIGAGIGDVWNTAREEALFSRGYGPAEINLTALAYYRYERIVEDIAAFCEQLLLSSVGGEDREQGLRYFLSNFAPGGVLEIARRTDDRLGAGKTG